MTIAEEIIRVFKKHPDWSSAKIADEVGCHSAYVRVTLTRRGLNLTSTTRKPNPRSNRDQNGWRIPNEGTKARAMYDLYKSGITASEICERLEMDANSVHPMLSRIRGGKRY